MPYSINSNVQAEVRRALPKGAKKIVFSLQIEEYRAPTWIGRGVPVRKSKGIEIFKDAKRTDFLNLFDDLLKAGYKMVSVCVTSSKAQRFPTGNRIRIAVEMNKEGEGLPQGQIDEIEPFLTDSLYTAALYFNDDGSIVFAGMEPIEVTDDSDAPSTWDLFFTDGVIELLHHED